MPKIFYLVPIVVGLGIAMAVQFFLANSDIPEEQHQSIFFVGLGASLFFSSLFMTLIQGYFERKKKKDFEEYKF